MLGFCVEASGKQDLAVIQIDDRHIELFITRFGPCVSSPLLKDQFALRKRSLAYAWEERILKRTLAVFIRKFASINTLMLIGTVAGVIAVIQFVKWVWYS